MEGACTEQLSVEIFVTQGHFKNLHSLRKSVRNKTFRYFHIEVGSLHDIGKVTRLRVGNSPLHGSFRLIYPTTCT